MQKIQIIRRKVDIARFDGDYFKQIRNSIQRNLNQNTQLLIIEFIPNMPIVDKSVLKSLLHLQREFTDVLIAPRTAFSLDDTEIKKLTEWFNATMIMVAT
jgi:hypothetical protein